MALSYRINSIILNPWDFAFFTLNISLMAVSEVTDNGEIFSVENSAPFKRKTVDNTSGRCQSFTLFKPFKSLIRQLVKSLTRH